MAEKHDREKLIDVALDLCIRQGYEATTIDQIAAAVGVTSHGSAPAARGYGGRGRGEQ